MAPVNPFQQHPMRRYAYAWDRVAHRTGRHLDFGCERGYFLGNLADTSALDCVGVDAHTGYLEECRWDWPGLAVTAVPLEGPTPFPDQHFQSVTLLDVLEHVPNEAATLRELHRILASGGILVVTVPARHLFSFLDPDNVKYRFPRLHRLVYTTRFGAEVYRERFVDLSNGMRGDMAANRTEHTNYRPRDLDQRLADAGFRIDDRSGANLFWRLVHGLAMLARGRLKRRLEQMILWDGLRFKSANLFVTAIRL